MSNSRDTKNLYKIFWTGAAAGTIGGFTDVLFCYPFFGEKIREQIQAPKSTSGLTISRLYRGALPYAAVVLPSTAVMFGITTLSPFFSSNHHSSHVINDIASGALSGISSGILTTPLVNTISKRELNPTLTSIQAFQALHRQGGWKRLYCGLCPTIIGDGIYAGGAFLGVPRAEKYLIQKCEMNAYQARFVASLSVGMFATFISQPFDTIATLMGAVGISSSTKVIKDTFKHNGIYGFYSGFFFRAAYIATSMLVVSTAAENAKKYIEESGSIRKNTCS